MPQPEQKKRNVLLDDFPGGLLIAGAILLVFVMDIFSGAKVIGVDKEKLVVRQERALLNKEKKEWDGIEGRIAAESAKLEALENKSKYETDRRDGLQKDNKTLDETVRGLTANILVLEARKEKDSKQEHMLASNLDELQQKVGEFKAKNSNLQKDNRDLQENIKKLQKRDASLRHDVLANENLKTAIQDFITFVENLKAKTDAYAVINNGGFDSQGDQGSDQSGGSIQDNTSKLLALAQSLQSSLSDIVASTDEIKAANPDANQPVDNTAVP